MCKSKQVISSVNLILPLLSIVKNHTSHSSSSYILPRVSEEMAPILNIATIQFRPKPLAVEENFALSASYIRHAASQGADIAVLPEYHLTSWCPDEPGFIQACRDSMPYLSKYQALSFELGIHIVPGTICEVHPSSSSTPSSESATDSGPSKDEIEIRNMTYFISPTPTLDITNNKKEGTIKGTYQKKNLWHTERPHLTAAPLSSPHQSFDVPSLGTWPASETGTGTGTGTGTAPIKVGLLICWDAIFPEAFRPLMQTGADLIIIPAFWLLEDFGETSPSRTKRAREAEKKLLESLITTRAYENTCTVVFVNAGGGSQVAGASVALSGQDDDEKSAVMWMEEEGVKIVAVDLGEDRKLEGRYKIREDLMRVSATEKDSIVMKSKEVERGNMG